MRTPILIVYSSLGLGGIPIRIIDIVNKLARTNPKTGIVIILKKKPTFDFRSLIRNHNVTILDYCDFSKHDSIFLFVCWLWFKILILNPSSILTFISPYALPVLATRIVFFWRKPKIIVNEGHFTSTMVKTMKLPYVQNIGIRLLYRFADDIIAPTHAIVKNLHDTYSVPSSLLRIIPNWTRYADTIKCTKVRPYDIVYTGRLEKEKNVMELLYVCKYLVENMFPSLSCVIVGQGSCKSEYLKFIKQNNLESNIHIYPPQYSISNIVGSAKLYICTSQSTTEGFPVSTLDAMALGTLVISRWFEGIEDVLTSDSAYIARSYDELVSKTTEALRNYSAQKKRILRAKQSVKLRFSKRNALEYIRLFKA